jgi:mono/diheme cytochrome c family protein
MSLKNLVLTLAAAAFGATTAAAKDIDLAKVPPASSRTDVTYAKDIKPIFEQSCVKCHGAEKPKAKLRLDSLAAALKGSADGKVIEPSNSAKSHLLATVAHVGHEDEWMPPPGNKLKIKALTKEEVGLIRAWIEQGAK